MTNKMVSQYISDTYSNTLKTITEISSQIKSKASYETPLVESNKMIYDFDNISEIIHKNGKKPASVDAMMIDEEKRIIYLIEFKSGFRQLINKQTYEKKEMTCPRYKTECSVLKKACSLSKRFETENFFCREINKQCFKFEDYCDEYGQLFLKLQELKKAELKDSIRMKAVEGYLTLEKKIFPICEDIKGKRGYKLYLIVVIDGNGDDGMASIMDDLSGRNSSDINNDFNDLKKSLNRYVGIKDANENDYYYDKICVISPEEFRSQFCN